MIAAFLSAVLLGCIYYLARTFIIIFQMISKKSNECIEGKIISLKSAKIKFDGNKNYKEYVYEFSANDSSATTIDFVESTSSKKKSKLVVGMPLKIYYNKKSKKFESIQLLKPKLFESILGFTVMAVIFIVVFFVTISIL